MQLAHDRAAALELRPERVLAALPEAEQADENVLGWVLSSQFRVRFNRSLDSRCVRGRVTFVAEEGLPAAVGHVVAPDELDLVRPHLVVDLLDADLAGAHVAALQAELLHPGEGELAQVAVFDAGADQRLVVIKIVLIY